MGKAPTSCSSLPDGSKWNPPWTPKDDLALAEGLVLTNTSSICVAALGQDGSTLVDAVDAIQKHMRSKRRPQRRNEEIILRINVLGRAFDKNLQHFRRVAKSAATTQISTVASDTHVVSSADTPILSRADAPIVSRSVTHSPKKAKECRNVKRKLLSEESSRAHPSVESYEDCMRARGRSYVTAAASPAREFTHDTSPADVLERENIVGGSFLADSVSDDQCSQADFEYPVNEASPIPTVRSHLEPATHYAKSYSRYSKLADMAEIEAEPDAAATLILRDADGFPLASSVVDALVDRTRAQALRRLSLPADECQFPDKLHAEPRVELESQLRRTAAGLENSTMLLIGPCGAGKHRLLLSSLARLHDEGIQYHAVHLHPTLITDENIAFRAVAAQLGVAGSVGSGSVGSGSLVSFCDGMRHVLHLLRRSQPGNQGQKRREGQAQPVCFILHEFDSFAKREKQTFLYSLFDLAQTDDAQMAIVGLTSSVDALDLLEKRVRSRFSGRQLLVPYLREHSQCAQLVCDSIQDAADESESISLAGGAAFKSAWKTHVSSLHGSLLRSRFIARRLQTGLVPRQLVAAAKLVINELSPANPFPSVRALEGAFSLLQPPIPASLFDDLSIVELILLACMKRLVDKEVPAPHTLRHVMKEYDEFVRTAPEASVQYSLPRAPLSKAFEQLCALGLVDCQTTREMGRASPLDSRPIELSFHPRALQDFIKSSSHIPLVVVRFATSWIE